MARRLRMALDGNDTDILFMGRGTALVARNDIIRGA